VPERRRTTLTPLESELRARETVAPATPGLVTRFRRRFRRKRPRPTTLAGAVLHGLVRLGLAVAVASGIALLLDHLLHRSTALGFYIVGAALLAVAFGTSTGLGRAAAWQAYTYGTDTQARRFNLGVAYVVAGAVVIAIAVAIEAAG
jgi:hypothetical protein